MQENPLCDGLTHHMARLAGRGNHHTVTDGESQEEVGDVGELQTG